MIWDGSLRGPCAGLRLTLGEAGSLPGFIELSDSGVERALKDQSHCGRPRVDSSGREDRRDSSFEADCDLPAGSRRSGHYLIVYFGVGPGCGFQPNRRARCALPFVWQRFYCV